MVSFIKSFKFRILTRGKNKKQGNARSKTEDNGIAGPALEGQVLSPDLNTNLKQIKVILNKCSDIIYREFVFAQNKQIRLALIYTDGLVDEKQVSDQIMRSLELEVPMVVPGQEITRASAFEFIKQRGLCVNQVKETHSIQDVIHAILSGDTALLVDGHAMAIINKTRGWEKRSIGEPESETVVRGSRQSFVESLRVNTALVRRIIKSPRLKMEPFTLGEITGTDLVVAYIEGIVKDKLVAEVKSRLERIKIDAVLESGYIEELIEDNPWSPFPTVDHTERPDRVAAKLLEGRVAILVNGTPYVLTVPFLLIESLQTAEDYYERFLFSSAIRLLRFLSMLIALTLPGFYVAIVSYNPELLPTTLLLSIAAQRELTPFPVFIAVLLMELIFEILREAGIRMPRAIGQTVSIVGALVMGQAGIQAGLVAASTVIVVALTGICSFVMAYNMSIPVRLLRFALLILSASMGFVGLISGLAAIFIHLCTIRSFGIPYLSPLAPITGADLKDTFIRAPWWAMYTRPRLITRENRTREEQGLKPAPQKRK